MESTAIVGVRIPLATDVRNRPKIAAANADLIEAEALLPYEQGRVDAEREAALRELERSEEALARAENPAHARHGNAPRICPRLLARQHRPAAAPAHRGRRLRRRTGGCTCADRGIARSLRYNQAIGMLPMNHLRNIAPTFGRALACATILLVMNVSALAAEPVRPAFEASSDMFELVGRIKDSRLSLTLDRWATNEPVSGARIEIDLNGRAFVAEAQADGSYAIDAAPSATPTTYPLTITVTAGDESDLLAADFVVASENAGRQPGCRHHHRLWHRPRCTVRARRCGGRHHPCRRKGAPMKNPARIKRLPLPLAARLVFGMSTGNLFAHEGQA